MPYRSIFRPGLFAGRVCIVTGGGTGIGRCIAHELVALGAHAILIGRRMERLEATAGELRAEGGTAECHALDIRDENGVKETVARIAAAHPKIAGLVNNAGGQFAAPLEDISLKGFDAVVRNNLTGGFLMSREVYRLSMREHGGSIVNITADMWRGMPSMGHSGAARAGMENLTKTAAVEWAKSGVRVNGVAPGWIASSGLDTYPESQRETMRNLHRWVPLKRWGTEAEVSAAVAFLLSDAAAFITGETIRVDGGAPLAPLHWTMPEHDRSRPFEGFHLAKLPGVLSEE
jgi:citronellol/citronellal dehydrogenase